MGNLSSVPSTKQSKFKPHLWPMGTKTQRGLGWSETFPVSLCSQKCKIQGIRWHVNEILSLQQQSESMRGRWWLTVSIPSITSGKEGWDFKNFLSTDCLMQNCLDESKYRYQKTRAASDSAFCQTWCTFLHWADSRSWVLVWERCLAVVLSASGSRVEVPIVPLPNSLLLIRSRLTLRVAEKTTGLAFLWEGPQNWRRNE